MTGDFGDHFEYDPLTRLNAVNKDVGSVATREF